jgi:hypothetical protein
MDMISLSFLGAVMGLFLPSTEPIKQIEDITWTCIPEYWSVPADVNDGMFTGLMEDQCDMNAESVPALVGNPGSGLTSLSEFFKVSTMKSNIVNGAPVSETYHSLPGILFDVTNTTSGSDSVTVRSDVHIATDNQSKLLYDVLSKNITGTGNGDLLKKINIFFEMEPAGRAGHFSLKVGYELNVSKPWYAPGDMFKNEVVKMATEKFEKERQKLMPDIASHL